MERELGWWKGNGEGMEGKMERELRRGGKGMEREWTGVGDGMER